MNRLAMSSAAAALLRALIARSGGTQNRILLTDSKSVDWRSLTFNGERHLLELKVIGADASEIAERMLSGLEDYELSIPGAIVADVGPAGAAEHSLDGSVALTIEALTVSDD